MVVRDEDKVLERKLQNLFALDYPAGQMEIVVVSDGSTDATESILWQYKDRPRFTVLVSGQSQGKANGLNEAIRVAQGVIVLFTDARQEIEPDAVRLLVENFADPSVGCVSGELNLGDRAAGESGKGMGLYWRIEKTVRELESASGSVVGATGALYAVRRELLVPLPPDTILDDVFLPMNVARQGSRVLFDGRAHAWDTPNLGDHREFARKVRTLSGNYQLLQLAPWLLGNSNPLRSEFISHKLLRLFAPFALVAALLSSALVPETLYRVWFVLQVVFYGLAALSLVPIRLGFLGRLADAASTFVVLNAAAVVAFVNFVLRRKAVWTPISIPGTGSSTIASRRGVQ
jgi:cellulose synthase/poly-beta-1,6-N-acetylglucosamine synthase-like glycosyltransferase